MCGCLYGAPLKVALKGRCIVPSEGSSCGMPGVTELTRSTHSSFHLGLKTFLSPEAWDEEECLDK